MKSSKAKEFGWVDNPNISWQDIVAKVKEGRLSVATDEPAASNSGFSAVDRCSASALAGTIRQRLEACRRGTTASLVSFFKGQIAHAGELRMAGGELPAGTGESGTGSSTTSRLLWR